jgi:hypothetical protein
MENHDKKWAIIEVVGYYAYTILGYGRHLS